MNSTTSLFLQLVFICLAAVGVYSFVLTAKDGEQRRLCSSVCLLSPDYAAKDRVVPDFTLPDLEGRPVAISDFRGKVVILNFWTKTCRPCLEEMPALETLGEILQKHPNIQLVTITTDESAEDANNTLRSVLGEQPSFTTLVDSKNEVVQKLFGTKLYPETWFVAPDGVIRARIDGPRDWHALAPLSIEFAKTLLGPVSCDVQFEKRRAKDGQCDGFPGSG